MFILKTKVIIKNGYQVWSGFSTFLCFPSAHRICDKDRMGALRFQGASKTHSLRSVRQFNAPLLKPLRSFLSMQNRR